MAMNLEVLLIIFAGTVAIAAIILVGAEILERRRR